MKNIFFIFLIFGLNTCENRNNEINQDLSNSKNDSIQLNNNFREDLYFLKKFHKDLILLGEDTAGPQIIVLPAYQGRVVTSSAEGFKGMSFGWINKEFISSNKKVEHINIYGGEERFWLGPEGGQFSIYFKKGVDFIFDNWYVPKELDTEPFKMTSLSKNEVKFEKEMHLENYSGTKFDLRVNRSIQLLNGNKIEDALGIEISEDLKVVGFESNNILTNTGTSVWDTNTGMLSIWILSMFNATDKTTVAIPYVKGDSSKFGKIVTDDYFGKVPAERLLIKNGLIFFKADANMRSKIGISPKRALPFIVSYDALNSVLTIAQFKLVNGTNEYVNSLWEIQKNPFSGDAVNAYNDGPINGKQMGKFFEMESSSPAANLAPGKFIEHYHRTIHLKGAKESLDKVAKKLLGIGVDEIKL